MAKKFITTKYGTKINVNGLTPEQVARVRKTAEGNGAYGSKGAALADTMRKRNAVKPQNPGTQNPTETEEVIDLGIDKNGGFKDPNATFDAAPDMPGATDLAGDAQKAREAAYGYTSRNYGRDKERDLAAAKQELAERGIPMDPTEGSLWSKTLQSIDEKYQDMDMQAQQTSWQAGNDFLATQSGVAKNANDAFLAAVLGMSDQELKKYGLGLDYKAKIKAIQAQKSQGGGGGGQQDTSPVIGGTAPGWNL